MKAVKKNSKFSAPRDNSTDETDRDLEHQGKEEIPSTDVQQTSFKSSTKTIHWNRIKTTSKKCEIEGILFLNNKDNETIIKEFYVNVYSLLNI